MFLNPALLILTCCPAKPIVFEHGKLCNSHPLICQPSLDGSFIATFSLSFSSRLTSLEKNKLLSITRMLDFFLDSKDGSNV